MQLITNPISAYLLIKQLIQEWADIKDLVENRIGEDLLDEIYQVRALNYAKNPTTVIFFIDVFSSGDIYTNFLDKSSFFNLIIYAPQNSNMIWLLWVAQEHHF